MAQKRQKVLCSALHGLCLILPSRAMTTIQETNADWSPRNLGRLLQRCFSSVETWQCLTIEGERLLEAARLDNSTWFVTDYLSIEPQEVATDTQRARKDRGFAEQLLQLMQGRALRLRLPKLIGIANGIDEIGSALGGNQGTIGAINDKVDKVFVGFASFEVQTTAAEKPQKMKIKPNITEVKKNKTKMKKKKIEEKGKKEKNKKKIKGRKKKDKDKHMAMMGGMIMLATLAQMFLGKVILIAGSAFIMAKIALVISLLGSLKKGTTGHSGKPEHVIVASSGHSHESGWHRSMPSLEEAKGEAYPGQDQAYYGHEMLEQIHRSQQQTQAAAAAVPTRGFY